MTDFLGPADAPNAVTNRPVETRTFAAIDSWFRDCSSDLADDGTDIQAAWLNDVTAKLRSVARVNGGKEADPTIKIVAENGSDDSLLAKAVQHLIQRGQNNSAADTGIANALVVTLAPTPPEYKFGMVVRVKAAATCTGATTINVNGLGLRPIIHPDGKPLSARDIVVNEMLYLVYDGASFHKIGAVTNVLTSNVDYYVNAVTGSDSNNGLTAGAAFATLQKAQDTITLFNMNGYNVAVHVADGDYAPVHGGPVNGTGVISYIGNVGNPAACRVTNANGYCFQFTGNTYSVSGFKLQATGHSGGNLGVGVYASGGSAQVQVGSVEFGYCIDYHMLADNGGSIGVVGPIVVSGGAGGAHMQASSGSKILTGSVSLSVTMTAPVTIGNWISCLYSYVQVGYASIINPSLVTGSKFTVSNNGVINTNGSGASYYPGNLAGGASSGGQYT